MLEQVLVVRRIVGIGIERLELETLHQTPPPLVPVAEIDGTVHRLHALAAQPVARRIEKHVGHLLRIDALEKAAAAGRLFLLRGLIGIVESGDTPDDASFAVADDPTDRLPAFEHTVPGRIEYRPYIVIQGLYPIAVPAIEPFGHGEKLPLLPWGHHLFKSILSHALFCFGIPKIRISRAEKASSLAFFPRRSILDEVKDTKSRVQKQARLLLSDASISGKAKDTNKPSGKTNDIRFCRERSI